MVFAIRFLTNWTGAGLAMLGDCGILMVIFFQAFSVAMVFMFLTLQARSAMGFLPIRDAASSSTASIGSRSTADRRRACRACRNWCRGAGLGSEGAERAPQRGDRRARSDIMKIASPPVVHWADA